MTTKPWNTIEARLMRFLMAFGSAKVDEDFLIGVKDRQGLMLEIERLRLLRVIEFKNGIVSLPRHSKARSEPSVASTDGLLEILYGLGLQQGLEPELKQRARELWKELQAMEPSHDVQTTHPELFERYFGLLAEISRAKGNRLEPALS